MEQNLDVIILLMDCHYLAIYNIGSIVYVCGTTYLTPKAQTRSGHPLERPGGRRNEIVRLGHMPPQTSTEGDE